MIHLIRLILIFSISTIPIVIFGQSASYFDGVDDKATVTHHSDFNLGTTDFTIEAIVRRIPMDQSMLTIVSKRNYSSNGFAMMVNTVDGIKFIVQIGKKVFEVDANALEDEGCHFLAVKRLGSEVFLYVDNNVSSVGTSTVNINTTNDLIIGADGANIHHYFQGNIEELRFWNIAREDNDIFDWETKCIPPTSTSLIADWSIEEGSGQFFHDVAQETHHAYLGTTFGADNEDPNWEENICLDPCCDAHAGFETSNTTPLAAQWVTFTNTSTGASTYEWSVDNQVVATTANMQHSFGMGVYVVRLKVTTGEEGCASFYSQVIEVVDNNFLFCDKETITSPEIEELAFFENLQQSSYPKLKLYDRFGNRYLPSDIEIPAQLKSAGSTSYSCSCGIFELFFEDMQNNRDYGFDDPILGADRRAVACRVFEDLSVLVNPTSTLPSNLVKIQVKPSEGKAPLETTPVNELAPGVLAVAGPYLIAGYTTGIIDGLVYKTITSGTNAIANTPGWNPNSYHGSFRVDFELPNFFLNNTNWTASAAYNEMDLYTTLLHESFHILGFYSLIDAENGTNLSKINGTQLYNRYDTYLQNTVGTPYIDPITGILNPASNFVGGANCAADVKYNGTSNPNHDVYLPAPWNFSILSHFNCNASNYQGCAVNNGYVMNACVAPGEMQRAPNQAEYSTLCDIGYNLSNTFGNSSVGTPANNVPYQTYTSCTPPCAVAAVDDNLTGSISVAAGSTVYINASSFVGNDNNPNNSYDLTTLLTDFGTINNVTTSGFEFTPNPAMAGVAIIQYHPTCSNGNQGSSGLIFITVTPIVLPCNLPLSSCNLLCNGDLEDVIYGSNWGAYNNISLFESMYYGALPTYRNIGESSDLYEFNNSGGLISFNGSWVTGLGSSIYSNFEHCVPNFRTTFGTPPSLMPLPVNFANGNRKYIGMGIFSFASNSYSEAITLSLNQALTPVLVGSSNNYRLGFWAFTTCNDIDVRMILSENKPCIAGTYMYSNLYDPTSGYFPIGGFGTPTLGCPTYSVGTNQGITCTTTYDANGPIAGTVDGWKYFTMDFYVTQANLDEVIFAVSTLNPTGQDQYILIDEITIEPLVPHLTISSNVIGTPCPGNKVTVEYNICADMPVTGVDLEAQIPVASGIIFTNALDFTNGHLTGLDLGVGTNPLCTLVRLEIEIPTGAATPSTQDIFLNVTGGTSCTSTGSNLTTSINIIEASSLVISVVPSTSGPVTIGNPFTVDITVENIGSNDIDNVVVDLLTGIFSYGLSYTFTPTNIGTITTGNSVTIPNVLINVDGPCGDAQICAKVTSAEGSCNLPSACMPLVSIIGTSSIIFPIETEDPTHNNPSLLTATALGSGTELYGVGLFSSSINFVSGSNTNALTHSGTCSSSLSPYLVKYNSCGFEWAVEIPACAYLTELNFLPDVELGQNGDVYVAFSFTGSFTINSTTYTSQGGADIAIIKYDNTGLPVWVRTEGGVGNDLVSDLEIYNNGLNEEVFIVGTLNGTSPATVTFLTAPTATNITYGTSAPFCASCSTSGGITYVAAYTDNGSSLSIDWVNSINAIGTLSGKLTIDPLGNVYATGHTNSSFSFLINGSTTTIGATTTTLNQGTPSASTDDIDLFVLKYNNAGTEIWAELYGSEKMDIVGGQIGNYGGDIECISTTNLGLIFSCGWGGTTGSQSYMLEGGVHLLDLDPVDGSLNWSQPAAIATTSTSTPSLTGNFTYQSNLVVDGSDYVITGSFYLHNPSTIPVQNGFSSINFHGNTISYADMDAYPTYDRQMGWFLERFDNTGTFQWVNANTSIVPIFPASDQYATLMNTDLEVDNLGNIYSPFFLRGTATIGTTNIAGGISGNQDIVDGFIAKFDGSTGTYLRPVVANNNGVVSAEKEEQTSANALQNTTSNITTKLYPNPTTGKVTLEIVSDLENNKVEYITIYDVTGRRVQQVQVNDTNQTKFDINLETQQSGVYFVEMMINQSLVTKRVILMN